MSDDSPGTTLVLDATDALTHIIKSEHGDFAGFDEISTETINSAASMMIQNPWVWDYFKRLIDASIDGELPFFESGTH